MSLPPRNTLPNSDDAVERSGGVDFQDDATIGGDVAGRDVVKPVTVVGFSEQAVRRLLLMVGALVFATAACFFSGGLVLGATVFRSLNTPLPGESSFDAAVQFQNKIEQVRQLPPGQDFQLRFSEAELSAYVNFIAGAQVGLSAGRARFIEPGRVAVGGELASLGNRPIATVFRLQENAAEPLKLESGAVQLLRIEGSTFGWVAVPNAFFTPFANQVNDLLGNFRLIDLQVRPGAAQWTVVGERQ
ncbi:MAG TPA: hypothetical protein VJG32_04710 [Anaerolineae bacterium]|nr:hypothetical protein [Anaerolineae bacterium]